MSVQDDMKSEIAKQIEKLVIVGETDEIIGSAKRLVVENYNSFHDATQTPPLTVSEVSVARFDQDRTGWRGSFVSPTVRGLLWQISFNTHRHEASIEVYKKIKQVKVVTH